jgi:hypothetical protein
MDPSDPSLEQAYLDQLTPPQQKAYAIAKRNLGSSFNLSLSIGFLEYKSVASIPKTTPSSGPH